MIEDEVLSRKMIKDVEDNFEIHGSHWCKYRLSICAYPNEKYVTVEFHLKEYPQGYGYEITRDFKSVAREYFSKYYPNWRTVIFATE